MFAQPCSNDISKLSEFNGILAVRDDCLETMGDCICVFLSAATNTKKHNKDRLQKHIFMLSWNKTKYYHWASTNANASMAQTEPAQFVPFPVNPVLQTQFLLPIVFVQFAYG